MIQLPAHIVLVHGTVPAHIVLVHGTTGRPSADVDRHTALMTEHRSADDGKAAHCPYDRTPLSGRWEGGTLPL